MLLKHEYTVRFVNAQQIQSLSHLERTDDQRMPKKILTAQVSKNGKRDRPRTRWLDAVSYTHLDVYKRQV